MGVGVASPAGMDARPRVVPVFVAVRAALRDEVVAVGGGAQPALLAGAPGAPGQGLAERLDLGEFSLLALPDLSQPGLPTQSSATLHGITISCTTTPGVSSSW